MSSISKFKVLIIGAGSIGERHLFNIMNLGIKNIAVYDKDPIKARQLAQKYKIHLYDDIDSYNSFKPDCSFICTYPNTHLELANFCLEENSHVFIEKPIATTMTGLKNMLEKAERKKLKVGIGYNLRFDKGLNHLKKKLNLTYPPLAISCQWGHNLQLWRPGLDYKNHYVLKKDGGIILDDSHEYDYLRWLLEDEVRSVYCQTQTIPSMKSKSEGIATMILRFRKGTVANLFIDLVRQKYERHCHVLSNRGDITWEFVPDQRSWRNYNSKATSTVIERSIHNNFNKQKIFHITSNQMYVDEVKNFLQAILTNSDFFVSGWEGLKTLKIGLAALKSASTNKTVTL